MKHPGNWLKSLSHAIHGLREATDERNMRFHLVATLCIIVLGFAVHLTLYEWCMVSSAIAAVLVCELINTAIECICDFITTDYSIQIKRIKDLSAASVLIASVYALLIALLIFIPKILHLTI